MFSKADLKGILFEAAVVDNNDPLNKQRVRIRVPRVHDKTKDGDLPWALKSAQSMCGNGPGYGSYNVPALGTIVYVEFQDGDSHNPMYSAERVYPISSFSKDDYGFQDIKGNSFKVSKTTGDIELKNTAGKTIKFLADGTVEFDVKDWNFTGENISITCQNLTAECQTAAVTAQAITVGCPSTDFNPS